ncbi:MAG: hypothetical protein HOI53_05535 [Francisellaceae bacterium]|jgi:uncharacterized membrane protein|nr:hypothetical protein [Francisellaceae bacterium]MBT6207469.1 hypothetical protein [Francisellaceae bacterium]MBT6539231.1 hypothetical protein [Francisellaceae bacterium]
MKSMKLGLALASAVAFSFASEAVAADGNDDAAEDKVKCLGGNSCQGHGQCATDSHACAGQNTCAGMGWVYLSKVECQKIPGATVAEE